MKLVCLFINLYLRPSCISEHDYWSVERYMITREHFTLANDQYIAISLQILSRFNVEMRFGSTISCLMLVKMHKIRHLHVQMSVA